MQTKLRTYEIVPNNNISFPIGTILIVEKLYDLLDFPTFFGKHKKNGIDINDLLKALVSYKLTDNFSIIKAHESAVKKSLIPSISRNPMKEPIIGFLKSWERIVKRLFKTSRTDCLLDMISNTLTSTWTGQCDKKL